MVTVFFVPVVGVVAVGVAELTSSSSSTCLSVRESSSLAISCSSFLALPRGVVLIVFSNDPLYRFVLGINSIDPCLVGLVSLETVLDVLAEAELSSGLSGTISVNPNSLGLRFFLTFRSYESL